IERDPTVWDMPYINSLSNTPEADLIRYGKELIVNTAKYLGPNGSVAHMSNGMNCENCHLDAGTRLNGNSFAMVASTYPKFRERSGMNESVEYRINDCMQRSLNGSPLDSLSHEMRAMKAYIVWLGTAVAKGTKLKGIGVPDLPLLDRAASPANGAIIFHVMCAKCHQENGAGVAGINGIGYTYPPLWGNNSYNVSAGIYRLSRLAGFIKYNMPFTLEPSSPQLTDAEAWDLAAFINAQERPDKRFAYDWPKINTKPFDYPFGPYADSFTEMQHKFGPYQGIKK
ncbi:MAG TPA: c-type cytochrome, partial [Ferruginibacter sp.]|nr:c-type cytochrome [Ferruginibacter sp.]